MAQLKRVLSFPVVLLITVNAIMGTGIYFLIGFGAKYAGAGSLISWGIIGLFAVYMSTLFGELTGMFPTSGGVYEFSKQVYGRFPSFLVGWLTFIGGNLTISMLIVGAISYIFPVPLPYVKLGLSLLFLWMFHYVAYRGMQSSGVVLTIFSMITLGLILLTIGATMFHINPVFLKPVFQTPASKIFLAVFFIAETFFGWEAATFLAGETKDGERNVPRALVWGTIIIFVLSFLLALGSIGLLGGKMIGNSPAPMSDIAFALFGQMGETIMTLLVYVAIIGAVACWIVSSPRLILSMAEDRLFIPHLAAVHPQYHSPHRAILFQGIVVSLLVILGQGSHDTLLQLMVPIDLILYTALALCVTILRIKKPDQHRPFKAPFGKIGGIIVPFLLAGMLVTWLVQLDNAFRILLFGISLILLGLPIYFLLEAYYNHRFVRNISNVSAYINLLTERFSLPLGIRQQILDYLGVLKNKKVLEFGCSVGTLTLMLAREVGPNGRVYATDLSEKEIEIVRRRVNKEGHTHVRILHDTEHHKRVHPDVPQVDIIVSVAMLGYLQDPLVVLTQMNRLLAKGSRICFVDYDKFFDIIPNIDWLGEDKNIRKLFHDAGFKVDVLRKQGFAWKYIFVYGIKETDV